jgi:hypothetical protein
LIIFIIDCIVGIINGTGNAVWIVPDDLKAGEYPVNASFEGDDDYLASNATGMVTVEKSSTNIDVDNVTAKSGNEVSVPISVTTDDKKPFNGNVTVELPDGTIKTVEVVEGSVNVTFAVPNAAGNYSVVVTFDGDDDYLASNATAVVTVIPKTQIEISIGDIIGHPGDEVTVPISVTADDGSLFNGNVTVILPDGTIKVVEIVNGEGSFYLAISEDLGNYSIEVIFGGDDYYSVSKGSAVLIVEKIPIEISVGNVTAHPGEDIVLPVDVTVISDESSGDLLMMTADIIVTAGDDELFNGNLTVALPDGSTQSVEIIDGKGNIAWTVPMGYEGDYPVTAIFDGNNRYLSANGTGIITVEKIPTEISLENIAAKPGKDITIPINVATEDEIPFNGNVTVELPDGTTRTVEIIDGAGETVWTVPGDYAGDYNYSVKYGGNDLYLSSNNTAIISVAPKVPVKVIVGDVTAKPGDIVTIPIKVIPEDGSAFNGYVTVTLPDGTTKLVEIVNGEGSVQWSVPEDYNGTYPIIVSFDGDDTYLAANGTGFITVIPDTPVKPVNPSNKVANPSYKEEIPINDKATGNPIWALLIVILSLVFTRRSRR